MNIVDFFDVSKYFGGSYVNFFSVLFNTFLNGWLARALGFICLGFSLWFWIRRDQLLAGIWFYLFAFLFAYGWIFARLFGFFGGK
ncbi:hypothetical protein [Thermodesulfovibrio sp. TK110]